MQEVSGQESAQKVKNCCSQNSVIGQIKQRREVIQNSSTNVGYVTVTTSVPLSKMFSYFTDLLSATQGKAEFTMEFEKYIPVPKNIQDEMGKKHQEKIQKEKNRNIESPIFLLEFLLKSFIGQRLECECLV